MKSGTAAPDGEPLKVERWKLNVERSAPRSGGDLPGACPDGQGACGGLNFQLPTFNFLARPCVTVAASPHQGNSPRSIFAPAPVSSR